MLVKNSKITLIKTMVVAGESKKRPDSRRSSSQIKSCWGERPHVSWQRINFHCFAVATKSRPACLPVWAAFGRPFPEPGLESPVNWQAATPAPASKRAFHRQRNEMAREFVAARILL